MPRSLAFTRIIGESNFEIRSSITPSVFIFFFKKCRSTVDAAKLVNCPLSRIVHYITQTSYFAIEGSTDLTIG